MTTTTSGLDVYFGTARVGRASWNDDGGLAWRVRLTSHESTFPMPFARRQDAEAAMRAIQDFADWGMSRDEFIEYFKDISRRDEVRRLMLEAMAW